MRTKRERAAGMTARSYKRDNTAGGRTFSVPCQDMNNSKMIEREVKTAMRGLLGRGSFKRVGAAEAEPQRPASLGSIVLMAVIAIFLSFALAIPHSAEADTLGPQNPTSGANDASVGTVAWSNPGNRNNFV